MVTYLKKRRARKLTMLNIPRFENEPWWKEKKVKKTRAEIKINLQLLHHWQKVAKILETQYHLAEQIADDIALDIDKRTIVEKRMEFDSLMSKHLEEHINYIQEGLMTSLARHFFSHNFGLARLEREEAKKKRRGK